MRNIIDLPAEELQEMRETTKAADDGAGVVVAAAREFVRWSRLRELKPRTLIAFKRDLVPAH